MMKGSTIPCNAYPIPIMIIEFGNPNNYDGPTQILTKNDRNNAAINTALFSKPIGKYYTAILIGM